MGLCFGKLVQCVSSQRTRNERHYRQPDGALRHPAQALVVPAPGYQSGRLTTAVAGLQELIDLVPAAALAGTALAEPPPTPAPPDALLELPNELIIEIARRLPLSDRVSLSETSRRLRALRPDFFPSDLLAAARQASLDDLPGLLAVIQRLSPAAQAAPLAILVQCIIGRHLPQLANIGAAQRLLAAVQGFPPAQRSILMRAFIDRVARDERLHAALAVVLMLSIMALLVTMHLTRNQR